MNRSLFWIRWGCATVTVAFLASVSLVVAQQTPQVLRPRATHQSFHGTRSKPSWPAHLKLTIGFIDIANPARPLSPRSLSGSTRVRPSAVAATVSDMVASPIGAFR